MTRRGGCSSDVAVRASYSSTCSRFLDALKRRLWRPTSVRVALRWCEGKSPAFKATAFIDRGPDAQAAVEERKCCDEGRRCSCGANNVAV